MPDLKLEPYILFRGFPLFIEGNGEWKRFPLHRKIKPNAGFWHGAGSSRGKSQVQ